MSNVEDGRAAYINQVREHIARIGIATDQAGVNGDTQKVTQAIHTLLKQSPNLPRVGIEMLAWSHQLLPDLLSGNARSDINRIPIVGYHSKLGTVWKLVLDTLVTSVSDVLLLHPETLAFLSQTQSVPPYVLIHNIAARSLKPKTLHMYNTFLAIENAANPGDYQEMLQQTRRIEKVLPVFDIVHYLRDHRCLKQPTPQQWQQMCDALAACGPCIVHLPIGQQAYDSLDFEHITDSMWQHLAQALRKHPTFVVVEYQPANMLLGMSLEKTQIDPFVQRIKFLHQHALLD